MNRRGFGSVESFRRRDREPLAGSNAFNAAVRAIESALQRSQNPQETAPKGYVSVDGQVEQSRLHLSA